MINEIVDNEDDEDCDDDDADGRQIIPIALSAGGLKNHYLIF